MKLMGKEYKKSLNKSSGFAPQLGLEPRTP